VVRLAFDLPATSGLSRRRSRVSGAVDLLVKVEPARYHVSRLEVVDAAL
jgi:hypothetical protein